MMLCNVFCIATVQKTVAAVLIKLQNKVKNKFQNKVTKLARWQHPAVGHRTRFAVYVVFCGVCQTAG